jgi:hypothetical protein
MSTKPVKDIIIYAVTVRLFRSIIEFNIDGRTIEKKGIRRLTNNGPDYRLVDYGRKAFIANDFLPTAGSKNISRYNYTGNLTRRRRMNYPRGSRAASD